MKNLASSSIFFLFSIVHASRTQEAPNSNNTKLVDFKCPPFNAATYSPSSVTGSCKELDFTCLLKHAFNSNVLEGFKGLNCEDVNPDIFGSRILSVIMVEKAFTSERAQAIVEKIICAGNDSNFLDSSNVAIGFMNAPYLNFGNMKCAANLLDTFIKQEIDNFMIPNNLFRPFLAVPNISEIYKVYFYRDLIARLLVEYEKIDEAVQMVKKMFQGSFQVPLRDERHPKKSYTYSENSFNEGHLITEKELDEEKRSKNFMHVCQGFRYYYGEQVQKSESNKVHFIEGEDNSATGIELKRKLMDYCDDVVKNGPRSEHAWIPICGLIALIIISFVAGLVIINQSKSSLRSKVMKAGAAATKTNPIA